MEELPNNTPVVENREGHPSTSCLNCGTTLTDMYCPHCGQRNLPKRQTLGELITNFISSFWSYESKFFKTGQYLLFKPGFLATEYCAGKRESYYHPARMYVFISFIYFLLFTSLPDTQADETATNKYYNQEDAKYKSGIFSLDSAYYTSREAYDSAQLTLPETSRHGWLRRMIEYREIELNQRYKDRESDFQKDFGNAFFNNYSKVIFFLLPVFALLLKLFYVRRDYYYSEHLVFSIYFYNFFFLAGSLYMLANIIPWGWLNWITVVIVLWIIAYLPLGMKRMYKQSWPKTILKFLMFSMLFSFCILIGILINLIAIVIFI